MPEGMPLNIGINGTALLSPKTGVGQYVYHLGREFLEVDGVKVRFFYANHWSSEVRTQPLPNISAIKAPVHRFGPNAYAVLRGLMQIGFSTGLWKSPVDLYHEPSYLAYRFSGPSVVTAHDASWVRYPETHPAYRLAALDRYFPRSLEAASAVLTDCDFVKREMVELFGVPPDKVFPVLLGVSPEYFPRTADECVGVLAKHGIGFGGYVLSVGTLEPRKNIPALIDAYAMLPEALQRCYPLVMVGMRGWLTSGLEARMRPLVEKGLIKPLGYVPDVEMPLIYSGAAAFVFPSLYEGFGLPPLEAMACGVPVVCSGTSSLPEVVGNAGLLVEPRDVDSISEALLRVLEDQALADHLVHMGIERAAGFTWKQTAAQTIAVYRHVLGR